METSYLKVAKSLSPGFSYPNFDAFIDNLNNQEMEWYATFRSHVTGKIEDYDFEELTEEGIRTILPVKTLAAMEIMKEGFGWNDENLINECKNDLRVRHALAIAGTEDVPPVTALNKFRSLLKEFEKNTGIDLMAELIEKITEEKGPVMKLGTGRIMLWAMRVA
ncbi:MAG: transposase [Flavobacteriales bacterium]|nr:transposase [Flavobacteriales bacterium]